MGGIIATYISFVVMAAMFSGSSRCVGPGFSDSASLKAFRTISGMTSGVSIRPFHLVTLSHMSTILMYWCDSLWIRLRSACPVIATTGEASR